MADYVLVHHGIKGQKWGIRRFQNSDGTLTDAGRSRYGTGNPNGGIKIDTAKLIADSSKGGAGRSRANVGEVMPFGKRKYVDKDGNLTEAGEKRYAREIQKNNQKAKDKRVKDVEDLKDPNKWVGDDLKSTKEILESTNKTLNEAQKLNAKRKDPKTERLDLSKMTDKELQDKINRERLERQYNEMFNEPQVNKGRERVEKIIDTTGTVIGIVGGIVGIAVGVNELMGKRG